MQSQLLNVNNGTVSKVRRELIKLGKYAVTEAAAPATDAKTATTT